MVNKDFASTLAGCSYITPIEWRGNQDTLPLAIQYARRYGNIIVAQAWKHPDQRRLTDSFAKEQWRLAGKLNEWGKWPLIFDQRSSQRESLLVNKITENRRNKPLVLVCTSGVSGPFKQGDKLIALMRGLDADVIDLDNIRAERFYDLLGLLDAADLLVTVDTGILHLARAAHCPVICLLRDGWEGALPPPTAIASWRYSEVMNNLAPVLDAAKSQITRRCDSLQVVVHTYSKGHCNRHQRAMATHPPGTIHAEFDHRPRVKELLRLALDKGKDGVIFTNDDVTFQPDTIDRIKRHLFLWDYGCSRRPRDPVHIGREIFFFRSDWLRAHWEEMPDPYWSVQKPDLILARWMRQLRGIPTTMRNLNYDFPPVEIPAGLITHEDHPSHWVGETESSKEGRYNEQLWAANV
jgi:hypothetical protein